MTANETNKRYRITEEEDGYWVSILASRSYPIPMQSFGPFDNYLGAVNFTTEWEDHRSRKDKSSSDEGGMTINVDLN